VIAVDGHNNEAGDARLAKVVVAAADVGQLEAVAL
jgi:hypothetical protein